MHEDDDELRAARGFITAILGSLVFYTVLGFALWLWM